MDKDTHLPPIRVALLAYGLSGSVFHAPLLSHHGSFHLARIWVRQGRSHPEEKYPEVAVTETLEEILTDRDIELVVVNTPEYTHFDYARKALLAGKHVIVEKAFTVTVSEAEELIRLARKERRMLSVFHNSRWHGDYLTIQEVVKNEVLGKLVEYEAHFDRFRNIIGDTWKESPRPGTGSLYNLGPHLIDQALQLFGWPAALWANLEIQRPGGKVCDYFELVLFYPRIRVTLKSGYLVRQQGPRYILHGTQGSFVKFGLDPQEAMLKAGKSPMDPDFGAEEEKYWGQLDTTWLGLHFDGRIETKRGSYMAYYDNVYQVIRQHGRLAVQPEQALQTMRIIEAAQKSQAENQRIRL